jgi:hypothetical protein
MVNIGKSVLNNENDNKKSKYDMKKINVSYKETLVLIKCISPWMVKRIVCWLNYTGPSFIKKDKKWVFVIINEEMECIKIKWNMCRGADMSAHYGASGLYVGSQSEYDLFSQWGPDLEYLN